MTKKTKKSPAPEAKTVEITPGQPMPPNAGSTGNTDEAVDNVSARIKHIRLELDLSQQDFADKIGVSASFIADIEAGRSRPGYEFIRKSTLNLQINPLFVVTGQGAMLLGGAGHDINLPSSRSLLGIDPSYGEKFIKDTEKMLQYFRQSNTVKMAVLEFFNRYLHANHDLITKEIKTSSHRISQ